MTKQNVRLTTINIALMMVLVTALIGLGWQQVGAQEDVPSQPTSFIVQQDDGQAGEEGDEPIHDCDFIDLIDMEEVDSGYFEVAKLFGMDEDGLWAELDMGKSLADIGKGKGIEPGVVIETLMLSEQELIDKLLASGEITAEEAAEWKAESAKFITFEVENGFVDPFAVARQTIGVSEDDFWTAIDEGRSIAEIAAENGVAAQTVIDAVVEADRQMIDAEVEAGLIDEDEAAEWRDEAARFAEEMVNSTDFFAMESMILDGEDGIEIYEFDLDEDQPESEDEEGNGE